MTQPLPISIARLPHGHDLDLPAYQTPQAAGMDLLAAIEAPLTLAPMQRFAVPCGFAMALPANVEAQIRPRSGLALKNGIAMPNSPGTIDADYRGEIKVILINLGPDPFVITRGMRIAQMIICPILQAAWIPVPDVSHLPVSDRGTGGFGSTG